MTKFLKTNLLRNKLKSNLIKKNIKRTTTTKKAVKQEKENEHIQIKMEIESPKEIKTKKNYSHKEQTKNKKQENKIKKEKTKKGEETIQPLLSIEAIKEHFYTFNLLPELYTILYTTLIFKWIQTDRVILLKKTFSYSINKINYKNHLNIIN